MFDGVSVLVGDNAKEQIRELAGSLSAVKRGALVAWLEGLTVEELRSKGVELGGNLRGMHQYQGPMFTVLFLMHRDLPVVARVSRN